jgi:hypothetical protein
MTYYRRRFRDDLSAFERQQRARNPRNADLYPDYNASDEENGIWLRAPSCVRGQTPAPQTPVIQARRLHTSPVRPAVQIINSVPIIPKVNPGPTTPDAIQVPPSFPNGNPVCCHRVLNAYIAASRQSRNSPHVPATATAHEVYKNYYMSDTGHIFRFIKTGPYASELTQKEESWMRSVTLSVLSSEGRNGRKIDCGCGFLERVCLLEK